MIARREFRAPRARVQRRASFFGSAVRSGLVCQRVRPARIQESPVVTGMEGQIRWGGDDLGETEGEGIFRKADFCEVCQLLVIE